MIRIGMFRESTTMPIVFNEVEAPAARRFVAPSVRQASTLSEWLAYLETLHPKAIAMGLDRVSAVFARLGVALTCPVVTVGGTSSITGPFIASLVLGIGDVAGKYYVPQFGSFVIYTIMIVVLIWRPQGLFSRAVAK